VAWLKSEGTINEEAKLEKDILGVFAIADFSLPLQRMDIFPSVYLCTTTQLCSESLSARDHWHAIVGCGDLGHGGLTGDRRVQWEGGFFAGRFRAWGGGDVRSFGGGRAHGLALGLHLRLCLGAPARASSASFLPARGGLAGRLCFHGSASSCSISSHSGRESDANGTEPRKGMRRNGTRYGRVMSAVVFPRRKSEVGMRKPRSIDAVHV
jgi:hypothetical protein